MPWLSWITSGSVWGEGVDAAVQQGEEEVLPSWGAFDPNLTSMMLHDAAANR